MFKKLILTIFFLLEGYCFTNLSFGQENNPIEFSVIPSIGFNFSFLQLSSGSSLKNFNYTKGLIGSRVFFWGIGLQAKWNNDLNTTISIGQTYLGGGFRYDYFPNPPETGTTNGFSTAGSITNSFSLNFEKKLWCSSDLEVENIKFSSTLNLLWGAGFYWIPPSDRTINTYHSYDSRGMEEWEITTPKNNFTGIVNIGLNNQFFINRKPSLKIGILYSYGLNASRETEYKINYFNNDNSNEDFNALTGKHRLLLYLEYPIVFYKNKAQKELIKKGK